MWASKRLSLLYSYLIESIGSISLESLFIYVTIHCSISILRVALPYRTGQLRIAIRSISSAWISSQVFIPLFNHRHSFSRESVVLETAVLRDTSRTLFPCCKRNIASLRFWDCSQSLSCLFASNNACRLINGGIGDGGKTTVVVAEVSIPSGYMIMWIYSGIQNKEKPALVGAMALMVLAFISLRGSHSWRELSQNNPIPKWHNPGGYSTEG